MILYNLINSSLHLLQKFKNIALLFFLSILIIIAAYGNINNPNFWFDESGQIWMSCGLNHFSPINSNFGSYNDILKSNNSHNLDPGGFTFLLAILLKVTTIPILIRFIPFLFFLLTLYIVYLIIKKELNEKFIQILMPFLLLLSSLISQYAFELRAYSFEMCITLCCLLFVLESQIIISSTKKSLLMGLLLSVGVTSRYSAIFPIFSCLLLFFIYIICDYSKLKIFNFILILLPFLITLILIYIFVFRYQNPTGSPPSYVGDLMLNRNNLQNIFFHPKSIFLLAPLLFLTFRNRYRVRNKLFYSKYLHFTYTLLALLLFASSIGKYPILFRTRFDIGIHSVLICAWFFVFIIFYKKIYSKIRFNKLIQFLILYIFCIIVAMNVKYIPNDSTYDLLKNCLNSNGKILANQGSLPTVKYLFELGPLKSKINIYQNIYFYSEYYKPDLLELKRDKVKLDEFKYYLFSFYNKNDSIYKLISKSDEYVLCKTSGPSQLFIKK